MDLGEIAEGYLGAPWKDGGRHKRGTDCIGLIIASCREYGVDIDPLSEFNATTTPMLLIRQAKRFMVRVARGGIRQGDIIYFESGMTLYIGILVKAFPDYIIHAVPRLGVRRTLVHNAQSLEFRGAFRLCPN